MQTYEFQAETKQLLDLMIHSIYSNKDIFLRELISNSSDALDRLRVEALTKKKLQGEVAEPEIRIEVDKEGRTLTVSDNGIGMSRKEVMDYIGTIAKSGTQDFLRILKESKGKALPPELIGQFGVGLYASFMVADKITMVTRRAGQKKGTSWESAGDGTYSLEEVQKDSVGTSVTLHLKSPDIEEELHDYTDEWKIREIVKKYSDYISHPIKMKVERKEVERDKEGKPIEGAEEKTVVMDETLNSMKAIWLRHDKEVSDEEYNEFYKHISHDWNDPMERIRFTAEGRMEFRGLLFIPSKAPFDMHFRDINRGIQLYIRRVFIMHDCKELIPEYLRFVRGVVDSEDLSLNISREILQQSRQIHVIRKKVTSKTLESLKKMKEKDSDKYLGFWNEFGKVLKEGLFQDMEHREQLLDLALFYSTESKERPTSLTDYVKRMKPGQDAIYYMTGKNRSVIEQSPHLEAFREKGYEVFLLTEPVDEVWTQSPFEYDKKPFKSVGKGTVDLGTEEEKEKTKKEHEEKEKEYRPLLEFLKQQLEEHVKDVRISTRLTTSPVCLVGETSDMTPQMEEMLRASGQEVPRVKRILEINPTHPVLVSLQKKFDEDKGDAKLDEYAELLYGQALIAEGGRPPEPAKFSQALADLMSRAM